MTFRRIVIYLGAALATKHIGLPGWLLFVAILTVFRQVLGAIRQLSSQQAVIGRKRPFIFGLMEIATACPETAIGVILQ
jgi:hypothetical protein